MIELGKGSDRYKTEDSDFHQVDEAQIVALLQSPHHKALRDVHVDLMTPMGSLVAGWKMEMVYRDEEVLRSSAVFPTIGPVPEYRRSYDMQQVRDNVSTIWLHRA